MTGFVVASWRLYPEYGTS